MLCALQDCWSFIWDGGTCFHQGSPHSGRGSVTRWGQAKAQGNISTSGPLALCTAGGPASSFCVGVWRAPVPWRRFRGVLGLCLLDARRDPMPQLVVITKNVCSHCQMSQGSRIARRGGPLNRVHVHMHACVCGRVYTHMHTHCFLQVAAGGQAGSLARVCFLLLAPSRKNKFPFHTQTAEQLLTSALGLGGAGAWRRWGPQAERSVVSSVGSESLFVPRSPQAKVVLAPTGLGGVGTEGRGLSAHVTWHD